MGIYPIYRTDYDSEETMRMYVLNTAYDIKIPREIVTETTGYETLSFVLPADYNETWEIVNLDGVTVRDYIQNECFIEIDDTVFIVRSTTKDAESNTFTVYAEARWYSLAQQRIPSTLAVQNYLAPSDYVTQILSINMDGWTFGYTYLTYSDNFYMIFDIAENTLSALRKLQKVLNCELIFDTVNLTVSLYSPTQDAEGNFKVRSNDVFSYSRNVSNMTLLTDTTEMYTAVTIYGKNNLTISSINPSGEKFLTDTSWYTNRGLYPRLRFYVAHDDRFTVKSSLMAYIQTVLNKVKVPKYTLEVTALALDTDLKIGNFVYFFDHEQGIHQEVRVVRYEKDVLQPHLSTLTLDNTTLTSTTTQLSNELSISDIQQQIADSGWINPTLNSRFEPYYAGVEVEYRMIGKMVEIRGQVKPTSTIVGSATTYPIFTLVSGFRPVQNVDRIMHGSTVTNWLLRITTDGVVSFSRLVEGGVYVDATTTHWLPFSVMFMVD